MKEASNEVLNEEQWKLEAQAVIGDVRDHVKEIKVADNLRNSNQFVYLNLTTLEGSKFCVELSAAGFAVVGNEHDDTSLRGDEHFETLYSLLDLVSPRYRDSFGNSLQRKLEQLTDGQ